MREETRPQPIISRDNLLGFGGTSCAGLKDWGGGGGEEGAPYSRVVSFKPQGKAIFPSIQLVSLSFHGKAMYPSDWNLYLPLLGLSDLPTPPKPSIRGETGKRGQSHQSPKLQPHSNKDLNTFPKLTRAHLSMPPLAGWRMQTCPARGHQGPSWDTRPGPCIHWALHGMGRARKPRGITVQPPTLHDAQPRALTGNGGEGSREEEGGDQKRRKRRSHRWGRSG